MGRGPEAGQNRDSRTELDTETILKRKPIEALKVFLGGRGRGTSRYTAASDEIELLSVFSIKDLASAEFGIRVHTYFVRALQHQEEVGKEVYKAERGRFGIVISTYLEAERKRGVSDSTKRLANASLKMKRDLRKIGALLSV